MPAAARRLRLLPAAPARLQGWPLPWGGQRQAVFHRVRSSGYRAADRKPRAVKFDIRITLYYILKQKPCSFLPPARESESAFKHFTLILKTHLCLGSRVLAVREHVRHGARSLRPIVEERRRQPDERISSRSGNHSCDSVDLWAGRRK